MRKVTVPVDMCSEQKSILGIISKRQLIYILVSGVLIYNYIPFVWNIFAPLNFVVAGIFCLVSALPVLAVTLPFAFIYKDKQHMYLDRYMLLKFRQKKEKGAWRRGK